MILKGKLFYIEIIEKERDDNVKSKREYALIPGLIILGIALGVFAKAGDVSIQGSVWGNILYSFGTVSTGIFIWVAICTVIAILSKSKLLAGINVFLFLTVMILAYYLYSYFVVGYFVWRIVKFWLIMLIPATVSGFIIWNIKTNRVLKYTVIVLGTVIMIFDMFILQGALPIAMIMDVILYVVFLVFILSKRFNKTLLNK